MPAAKGGASPALAKAKNELSSYRGKLSQVRKQARESELPNALMGAGAVLGGAAGCGVVRAFVGDEWMGVPTDVGLGLLVGGISIGMGSSLGVYFAAGCLAPYVGDAAKDAVSTMAPNIGLPTMLGGGDEVVIEEEVFETEPVDLFGNAF